MIQVYTNRVWKIALVYILFPIYINQKPCHEWSKQPLVVLATTRCNYQPLVVLATTRGIANWDLGKRKVLLSFCILALSLKLCLYIFEANQIGRSFCRVKTSFVPNKEQDKCPLYLSRQRCIVNCGFKGNNLEVEKRNS